MKTNAKKMLTTAAEASVADNRNTTIAGVRFCACAGYLVGEDGAL
jgi:hypothetical protein